MSYSITRALSELKVLDSRINRAIQEGVYAAVQIGSKKINDHIDVTDFNENAKASLQSVKGLIARRQEIKDKIVASNATTIVKISGIEMTVASAIERKTSIVYEKALLMTLRQQYNSVVNNVSRENVKVREKLDKHIETMLGKETKGKEQDIEVLTNSFNSLNEAKVIDPLKLKDVIDKLTLDIEGFESEVDFVLSESNTRTELTITTE